ncbi:hypothetical protein L1987_18230 [Smallanthus sonchifolius]|uniref:Uncharacterized protein n=1 Tax=Smallanthus sonchifolius TaxID=185202 RepID=A0ACB9J163_9ASTR|nr:hypothetical protein L1987_18230 [Smallanthus sonchifolius]
MSVLQRIAIGYLLASLTTFSGGSESWALCVRFVIVGWLNCRLHIALEKTKNLLQLCADCSKLYLAITGDSVVLKFGKAKSAPEDSITRVEDMVPQTIGSQAYSAIDTPDYIALEVLLKKGYSLECVVYEYSIMYSQVFRERISRYLIVLEMQRVHT